VLTPGAHSVVVKFVEFGGGALLHVLANGVPLAAGLELQLLQQHDVLGNTGTHACGDRARRRLEGGIS
jgi:hypothetical protein